VTLAVTGNTISGRGSASEGAGVSEASIAVDRKSMGFTVADGLWNEADFLCIFLCLSCICMAVMGKCCDACGDREYYFRSGFLATEGAGVSEASTAVDRKSLGFTVADGLWNEADFLCIFLSFL
jgi:hypothetical protein